MTDRGNANLPHVARIVDLDRGHPDVDLQEPLIPDGTARASAP